jgi:hypothetical protein
MFRAPRPCRAPAARAPVLALALAAAPWVAAPAADVDVSRLPPPAASKVEFDRDVRPIFENACHRCHGTEKPRSKFSLASREQALKGGSNGIDIIPGQSARSPLIHFVAGLVEDMEMPPAGKGGPLTPQQIGILRAWIDQGAEWSATAPQDAGFAFAIIPAVQWISVSGSEAKFREHQWTEPGWSGGVQELSYHERLGDGGMARLDVRALPGLGDYRVALSLEQRDLGFVRAGFQQFQRYYNDAGGYDAPFQAPPIALGRDLETRSGRAWIDLGLARPDWPRMTLGYEYQYRDGEKSTLQWGGVESPTGLTKNIYPAAKQLDEAVHILKLDLTDDVEGTTVENNFRAEFYDLSHSRENVLNYRLGAAAPDRSTVVAEGYDHFQAANAIRLERQLKDWLLVSGGYLYSYLDGEASFNQSTFLGPAAPGGFVGEREFWSSQQILLDQQSHVFNANAMLGPWQGLTAALGVQSEWMRQRGFGEVRLDEGMPGAITAAPTVLDANLDRNAIDESVSLRYTSIPFTVLFAEARLQQERVGQYEDSSGPTQDFLRDTDAEADLFEWRAGFNVSPWRVVTLSAHYKQRARSTDYDHLSDYSGTDAAGNRLPGVGYSAFIRGRDVDGDEVETKLVLRPLTWLKTTLSYRLLARDYETATDPIADPAAGTEVSPGGELRSGDYDASVYSINTTLTPWRRWYLNLTFSYYDSNMRTAHNADPAVADYDGDVYRLLASATYILDKFTDLQFRYHFSKADYAQANDTAGLPLGMVYDLHGVEAGVRRRFRERFTANLGYGFYDYSEPSSAQANDYTAHGVFASLGMTWP